MDAKCDTEAHLGSDEGGPDVEAGVLGVGNPVLVDLHQLPDALQQLTFIKQLGSRSLAAGVKGSGAKIGFFKKLFITFWFVC